MDTSDPEITFDEQGICNQCKKAEGILNSEPYALSTAKKEAALEALIQQIKQDGKGKPYDCIIGLSGGIDSTYVAHVAKQRGLRPLAVHLDNGWNSELSVHNIESICKSMDIDLYTHVMDWEEFKDLQLAFLRSSTPDSEIPTDHAINALLYQIANRNGVRYILHGLNSASESILPMAWSQGHQDWKYIKSVHRLLGTKKLRTFPRFSLTQFLYYTYARRIKAVKFLDYLHYNKEHVKVEMVERVNWRDPGRKHSESIYTRIYQEYILPTKFGFDKRRAHYSSLIMAGQSTRAEALESLALPLYASQEAIQEDVRYLISKFGITMADFEAIMATPPKSMHDFPNHTDAWYFRLGRKLHHALGSRR